MIQAEFETERIHQEESRNNIFQFQCSEVRFVTDCLWSLVIQVSVRASTEHWTWRISDKLGTWRIIPDSRWLVTPIYKKGEEPYLGNLRSPWLLNLLTT